jgi:hypothetical protein
MRRADNLTTFMCRLSRNLGASTCWNPKGLSRPVMGLLYLYLSRNISGIKTNIRKRRDSLIKFQHPSTLCSMIRFVNLNCTCYCCVCCCSEAVFCSVFRWITPTPSVAVRLFCFRHFLYHCRLERLFETPPHQAATILTTVRTGGATCCIHCTERQR